MAAENCSVINHWSHHRSVDSWFSDALFARDNEALTQALQTSISNSAAAASEDASAAIASPDVLSASLTSSLLIFNQLASNEMAGRQRDGPMIAATGRVAKRKSRASKRTPTTYINADPASFRELVQRVTGVRTNADVDDAVVKPLPFPPSVGIRTSPDLQQMCLPTLDTSAFLLDRGLMPLGNGDGIFRPAAVDGSALDVDASLPCFPTLESWGVM